MMRRIPTLLLVATSLAGCERSEPRIVVGSIELARPADSGEPNLFGTADGRAILTWLEPSGDSSYALMVARRGDAGWSEARTVRESDHFFVNWADFPSLIELAGGEWLIHWLEKVEEATYAYHVRLAISSDGGATWSEPITPHRDDSPTEHGFVSMVPTRRGGAALIWLDGRQMATEDGGGGGEHGGLDLGEMSIRATTIGAAGGLGEDVLLDSRTCECCQTALVATGEGLLAAYRDRSESEIRDIAVVRGRGNVWTEPERVAADEFYYPGCPVNGPQLSAVGDEVVVAWYTAPEQVARVYAAFSADGGASFGSPIRIDEGDPLGRVDVERLSDGSALVTWLERTASAAEVRARLVRSDGWTGAPQVVSETSESRASGFQRLARAGDELVIAWTLAGPDGGVRVASLQIVD